MRSKWFLKNGENFHRSEKGAGWRRRGRTVHTGEGNSNSEGLQMHTVLMEPGTNQQWMAKAVTWKSRGNRSGDTGKIGLRWEN